MNYCSYGGISDRLCGLRYQFRMFYLYLKRQYADSRMRSIGTSIYYNTVCTSKSFTSPNIKALLYKYLTSVALPDYMIVLFYWG